MMGSQLTDFDRLVRQSEAAKLLDVSVYTITRWRRAGKIDAALVNGRYMIYVRSLEKMVTPIENEKKGTA